jgi:TM2 domain-containing membrane protein YozV
MENTNNEKRKSFQITLLLCFFLGHLGAHRFYVGKIGTGILMLLTAGGLGIWYTIDMVMIILGKFKTKKNKALQQKAALA